MPFPVLPVLVASGAMAVIAGIAAYGARDEGKRLLRELQSGARRTCGSLRHGEIAAVVGRVEEGDRALTAPLSGRTCVAWEVSVWCPTAARTFHRHAYFGDHVPFALRDATGRARVEVAAVRSYGVVDHEERAGRSSPTRDAAKALLEERGLGALLAQQGSLILKESVLSAGETAVVVGTVHAPEADGGRATYRDPAYQADVALVARPGVAILFSDAPEAVDPTVRSVVAGPRG